MLDKNKVHIGIAPIAWTEDDVPEMGAENSFLQTISEIALSGYTGTEIGCQYPRDPAILNQEFYLPADVPMEYLVKLVKGLA